MGLISEAGLIPNALHSEPLGIHPDPRKITIEESIMRQLDRIGYLRSIGQDWREPVFHLRDLLVGLEDEEFFNGIPMNLQKKPLNKGEILYYRERGWDHIIVRHRKKGDYVEMDPTPVELSRMLRIIMALLARKGLTWKSKVLDEIPDTFEVDPA